jgi:hypothetical protein
MRAHPVFALAIAALSLPSLIAADQEGWFDLFDGRSLAGWKAAENPATFRAVDGVIVADGPRSHLFYVGAEGKADFRNFEFSAEVMTGSGANSGIYFHTAWQDKDWPLQGFEVQLNNSQPRQGNYYEFKKTGSLYGTRNLYKAIVRDNEWFRVDIRVAGKGVQVRLNGIKVVDYVEPEPALQHPDYPGRALGHGTFALQGHDPESKVRFRNLRVRKLPDTLGDDAGHRPVVDDYYREVLRLNQQNFPLVNLHAHLKGGLTMEGALEQAQRSGINFGIAVNCGVGFAITNDAGIEAFLESLRGQPVFVGMQAEGREWVGMFSPESVAKFDYVFTDAMTFYDRAGRRTRLWIKDEVYVGDRQEFMDTLVERTVGILNREPVDIWVNPTFLPDELAADYDHLWTPERMQRVIDAAIRNRVALEINARYRLPSPAFLKLAKAAGAKFTFGTNNGDRDVGRLDYCFEMVKQLGLKSDDMFLPGPGTQAIRRKPLPPFRKD